MNRKLYLYVNAFSDFGSRMDFIVLSALIYTMTNSALWLALSLGIRVAGGLCSSIVSGVFADRLDRRKMMLYSDVLRAVIIFFPIPFSSPSPTMIIIVSFLIGFVSSFFQQGFNSSIPQIFGEDNVLGINSLIARLTSIVTLIGFVGGGVISDRFGFKSVLAVDALSYVLSALFILSMKWESKVQRPDKQETQKKGYFSTLVFDIREVFAFLAKHPILSVVAFIYFAELFGASSHNLGFPLLGANLDPAHQATMLGVLWSVEGLGGFIASFILPKVKWIKENLVLNCLWAPLLQSFFFLLTFMSTSLYLVFLFCFIAGMFDAAHGTLYNTLMQQTNNSIRGRIFGVSSLLNRLGFGIGFVVAPLLLNALNLPHMVLALHGSVVLLTFLFIFITVKNKYHNVELTSVAG